MAKQENQLTDDAYNRWKDRNYKKQIIRSISIFQWEYPLSSIDVSVVEQPIDDLNDWIIVPNQIFKYLTMDQAKKKAIELKQKMKASFVMIDGVIHRRL